MHARAAHRDPTEARRTPAGLDLAPGSRPTGPHERNAMNRRRHVLKTALPALLACLAALAACAAPPAQRGPADEPAPQADIAPAVDESPIAGRALYGEPDPARWRVGLLLPLSGDNAALGRDLLDAATLALSDIASERIELAVADTGGENTGPAAALRLAAAGPRLVVGPLFSANVRHAAEALRRRGLPMIALSSDLDVARPGVFVLGHAPETQIARVIGHAADNGHARFAVLAPRNAFGERIAEAAGRAVARSGGALVARAHYDPGGSGIEDSVRALAAVPPGRDAVEERIAALRRQGDEAALAEIRRLRDGKTAGVAAFDALVVAEEGALLRRLAAWLGHFDVRPARTRLLGLAGWDDPALVREPVMKGAWFAGVPDTGRQRFEERFRALFGRRPAGVAALAYDAMALAATLSTGGREITDWRGFAGLDGPFRFAVDGRPERGLSVMEISPGGIVVADPAPTSFRRPDPAAG